MEEITMNKEELKEYRRIEKLFADFSVIQACLWSKSFDKGFKKSDINVTNWKKRCSGCSINWCELRKYRFNKEAYV
jgi:hypothetical protein